MLDYKTVVEINHGRNMVTDMGVKLILIVKGQPGSASLSTVVKKIE